MEILNWADYVFLALFFMMMVVNCGLSITTKNPVYVATIMIWALMAYGYLNSQKIDYLIELQTPPAIEEIVE